MVINEHLCLSSIVGVEGAKQLQDHLMLHPIDLLQQLFQLCANSWKENNVTAGIAPPTAATPLYRGPPLMSN